MGEGFVSRFKAINKDRITHSRLWGTTVLLLLLSTLLSACSYYYYTVAERTGTEKKLAVPIGYLQFEAGQVHVGQGCTESEELLQENGYDASIPLMANVLLTDTVNPGYSLRIVVDSVDATLAGGAVAGFGSPPVSRYYSYGLSPAATICPIWIPNDYKQDFVLRFRLRAYDDETGDLLMDDIITVTIVYHRERYFIFDAPYG